MTRTIHIICGGTGAGKSTFSKELAKKSGAIHFAIDDWIARLYGDDKPHDVNYEWYAERIARIETMMWLIIERSTADYILDLGFSLNSHRQKFYDLASKAGISAKLHYLDVSEAERWRRVCLRNEEKGETFALTVSREDFDFMEDLFERPDSNEPLEVTK